MLHASQHAPSNFTRATHHRTSLTKMVYVASKQYKRKLYQPGGRSIINHSSTCSARYSSLVYAQRSSCRCSVKAPQGMLMRVIPASEHSDKPSWFLQIEIKHQTTRKAAKLTKFNYFPAHETGLGLITGGSTRSRLLFSWWGVALGAWSRISLSRRCT
jgi:hypothetical protein